MRAATALALVLLATGAGWGVATSPTEAGARLYRANCAPCHGPEGRGDGPDAALFPDRPRNLHDGVLGRYETDALVRRIRDGRTLALPLDPAALRARIGQVDAIERHLRRIPAVGWPAVRRGEDVYTRDCEACHGALGDAPSGALDLASPVLQRRLDDQAILALVRRGHDGMAPPAPPLRPADERDLLAFVRVLSPGFIRYSRYCAPCHGDDGQPPAELPADVPRPTVIFDAAYFERVDPRDLETAVWHMTEARTPRMPHMGVILDESQVRAIVEWLRRQAPAPR